MEKKFTQEELINEIKKIKIPKFVIFSEKFFYKYGRNIMIFGFISFIPLALIYTQINNKNVTEKMWNWMLIWFGITIVFNALLMLSSHIVENIFVINQAKKLGITRTEFVNIATTIGIKSYYDD